MSSLKVGDIITIKSKEKILVAFKKDNYRVSEKLNEIEGHPTKVSKSACNFLFEMNKLLGETFEIIEISVNKDTGKDHYLVFINNYQYWVISEWIESLKNKMDAILND